MNQIEIHTNFINKFILKEKRERVSFELNNVKKRNLFINKLNHKSFEFIDSKKLIEISKSDSEFYRVKEKLGVEDNELSLIISNYDQVDNKQMSFREAFEFCNGLGLATLIIIISKNKIYLQTEQEIGAPNKYLSI
jgi:hypothetical protein